MSKVELLEELEHPERIVRALVNKLTPEWQLVRGDEDSRALRGVCDTLGIALSNISHAARKVSEMGDW